MARAALAEMRSRVDEAARRDGPLAAIASRFDRFWRETRALEHLDDPALPAQRRIRAAVALDRVNEMLGNYESVYAATRPWMRLGAHVLEICAGHGGLSAMIAERSAREGLGLRVTATDLRPEYLTIGEQRARERGCAVVFAPLDALQVGTTALPPADLIVSAQSLHHFEPGMVAMLFARAAAAARVGVVFMDGCRNALLAPALAVLGAYTRNYDVAHDGLVSFRRFFAVEELALLCGLSQPRGAVEARWSAPAHAVVRCLA